MRIPYVGRSRFLDSIRTALTEHRSSLDAGRPVHVRFDRQGYNGQVRIRVVAGDDSYFEADWFQQDHTRFPARLKAAATALRDCRADGDFILTHHDGDLTVQRTAR